MASQADLICILYAVYGKPPGSLLGFSRSKAWDANFQFKSREFAKKMQTAPALRAYSQSIARFGARHVSRTRKSSLHDMFRTLQRALAFRLGWRRRTGVPAAIVDDLAGRLLPISVIRQLIDSQYLKRFMASRRGG